MLTNVAVLAYDGVAPFELGVLCEAFGLDRTAHGVPRLDFAVCAESPGPIPTSMGFSLQVDAGLDRVRDADLVAVPAMQRGKTPPEPVLDAIREAYDRGARILSVCSGAFALGEAGLLDGRECTTHWMYTDELQRRFPEAKVVPEVLYVDDRPGRDQRRHGGRARRLPAHLAQEYGAAVASMVARRAVVPPAPRRRPGAVHRPRGARLRRRHPGTAARPGSSRTSPRTTASTRSRGGR